MWQSASRTFLACLASSVIISAQAQSISPLPETGLWKVESTTLINGQDLMAAIRETQRAMLAQLPPEQRAMMESMMQQDADEEDYDCITESDLANFRNPESLMADIQRDMPGCTISLTESTGNRMAFTGTCDGADGFTGDMQGEIVMVSAREMRHSFSGKGTLDTPADELPPSMQGMSGTVQTEHTEVARWVAADCR
ncbi:MAG: DUF3617 domain-containing protein [Gammaproteobacteria bacterium]|nr:DUF3617 domain-containing protein [Gammaproteobacteria bacterium]